MIASCGVVTAAELATAPDWAAAAFAPVMTATVSAMPLWASVPDWVAVTVMPVPGVMVPDARPGVAPPGRRRPGVAEKLTTGRTASGCQIF